LTPRQLGLYNALRTTKKMTVEKGNTEMATTIEQRLLELRHTRHDKVCKKALRYEALREDAMKASEEKGTPITKEEFNLMADTLIRSMK